jgi:hypothetical protein
VGPCKLSQVIKPGALATTRTADAQLTSILPSSRYGSSDHGIQWKGMRHGRVALWV